VLKGSGVRDTARVLGVSPTTGLTTLKKAPKLHQVNPAFATAGGGSETEAVIHKVEEAELEERWSFVGSKQQPRWLWEALNRTTQHSYTSSPAVVPVAVRPERSKAKSKASKPARIALFDFAADAATLRANGCGFAQKVRLCANLLWFDLDHRTGRVVA
jgi:hypothetical protein